MIFYLIYGFNQFYFVVGSVCNLIYLLQNESIYNILYLFFVERDKLVWYKFKWIDVDIKFIDNRLDVEEFFSFRYLEYSVQLIENMVFFIINFLGKIFGRR